MRRTPEVQALGLERHIAANSIGGPAHQAEPEQEAPNRLRHAVAGHRPPALCVEKDEVVVGAIAPDLEVAAQRRDCELAEGHLDVLVVLDPQLGVAGHQVELRQAQAERIAAPGAVVERESDDRGKASMVDAEEECS